MRAFWPDKLSHYSNRELLGAGQFGLVYLVENPELKQKTIIKIIEAIRDIDPVIIKRFRREIKSLQKLDSLHIVKLLNYWIDDSFLAFETEYINGISLEHLLGLFQDIPYPRKKEAIFNIVYQICQGLEYLHRNHLVHRDIKPSNLLLELKASKKNYTSEEILSLTEKNDFCCKITDLGIVKELGASVSITRTSDFIGTAAYISPEQAVGKKVGQASDLYSLGVLWYQLITGANPYYRKNVYHTINAHLNETAPDIGIKNPEMDQKLSGVIMRLLKKEPNQRGYNAGQLLKFLETYKQVEISDKSKDQISLLKEKRKKHHCPAFEEYFIDMVRVGQSKKIISAAYQDRNTLNKFFFHLENLQVRETIQEFYYFPVNDLGFLYNFVHSILAQAEQTELQEFKKHLAGESLFLEFFNLYSREKISDLEQSENDSWSRMQLPLKLYNWIEFVARLLSFLSQKRPVIIFLNLLNRSSDNSDLLILLMERLMNENLFWFYLGTESTPFLKNVRITFSENETTVDLDNLFKEKIQCRLHSREVKKYAILMDNQMVEEKRKKANSRPVKEISGKNLALLKILATLGPIHSIDFIHWIVRQKADDSGKILNALFQKNLLQIHSNLAMEGMVSFTSGELYQNILSGISTKKRAEILRFVLPYWENQDKFTDQFILVKIYRELQEFNKLQSVILNLFNLGILFGDLNMNQQLLNYLTKSSRMDRSKLLRQLNVHRIIILIAWRPKICLHWIAKNLLVQISDKYINEKHALIRFMILNALCLRNQEIIKDILSDPIFGKLKMTDITANLNFLEAFSIFLEGNFSQAVKKLSESLMDYYKNELYYNIPFCTYTLAQFYVQAREWENAYKYAAMGYHAGKAINDYWVMKKCVELILQNEYYLRNQKNLVDWKRITLQDIKLSAKILKQVDFRTQIFATKR